MISCPVYISSSDSYSDLWPVFFELFRRHWPGYTGRIYLNTGEKAFSFEGLDIVCTKAGTGTFGKIFRTGLDKVDSERIMLVMIDYLFMGKIDDTKLGEYYDFFVEKDLDSLCLIFQDFPNTAKTDHKELLNVYPPAPHLMFSFQIAFWKKNVLAEMVFPHENPWTSEWYGSQRAEIMKLRLAAISDNIYNPIDYHPGGCLHKGRWTEDAIKYLEGISYNMDFSRRGIYREAKQTMNDRIKVKWMITRHGLSGSYFDLFKRRIKHSQLIKRSVFKKANLRLRGSFVGLMKNSSIYPLFYSSWWHHLLHRGKGKPARDLYFSATPNPGAGIGHQMANWISGYWFARQLGLKFAHIPFSAEKWEKFLGFGEGEVTVEELIRQGYRKVRLPYFKDPDQRGIELIKKIISSYHDKKVIFMAEQDQFYRDQYGIREEIKRKFFSSASRKDNRLLFSSNNFNIAVHIRRGDLHEGIKRGNENYIMRWQDTSYFKNILDTVASNLRTNKPLAVYLISEGRKEDFSDFEKIENINFCLEMSAQDAFLHMVYADMLITSKSSFSYKPALISNGIKVCPRHFWHGYPDSSEFLLADDSGRLEPGELSKLLTVS